MMFEEFLDMMSVLSENAPREVREILFDYFWSNSMIKVKADWAFKMFDYDGDGKLRGNDIANVVRVLIGDDDDPEEQQKVRF